MSARSRELPRRSVLVVPGSSERFILKARSVPCDMVLLDLEDAVAPAEKAAARERVSAAIREYDWGERIVCVRLNGWSGDATLRDVLGVVTGAGARLDSVMLPKVRRPGEVVALELLLDQVEQSAGLLAGHVGIEVIVETAPALAGVHDLCASSPRLEAVALGPADLGAALGIPTLSVGVPPAGEAGGPLDPYYHVLASILVAARAHGLHAVDGPYAGLTDALALRSAAERSRSLGFDGKWAIHPDQVPILNELFSPTDAQLERAARIVDALEAAACGEGRGAIRLDGEMIDEASRALALRTLGRVRHDAPGSGGGSPSNSGPGRGAGTVVNAGQAPATDAPWLDA